MTIKYHILYDLLRLKNGWIIFCANICKNTFWWGAVIEKWFEMEYSGCIKSIVEKANLFLPLLPDPLVCGG